MTEADDNSALSVEQQETVNVLERLLGRAIADRYVDLCRFASGVVLRKYSIGPSATQGLAMGQVAVAR